jgi:transposase-like protein
MQRNQHSKEFKDQALSKARERGTRTLESVAAELNMPLGTLKGWLKTSSAKGRLLPHEQALPSDVPARQWTPVQRLLALNESHALVGPALHAWCREKGLFEHQLMQWREAFCSTAVSGTAEQRAASIALRDLQRQHEQLQRELHRKDRALAEAAALLVLQKKFQALVLQSEGEDK